MTNEKNLTNDSTLSRRAFISTTLLAMSAMAVYPSSFNNETKRNKYKGIAFDGFVIFNPKPVADALQTLLGEKATAFNAIWKSKQFEYTWLRTAAQQYKNFWEVTEDSLAYTLNKTGTSLTIYEKERLMNTFLKLDVWPDTLAGLQYLKEKGIKLGFLSNFTQAMLEANCKYNGLESYFDFSLSTDLVDAFKPSPNAYQMGIDHFKLKKSELAFAAFGSWDAAGSKLYGYPTFWVNRANQILEELDVKPDFIVPTMTEFVTNF